MKNLNPYFTEIFDGQTLFDVLTIQQGGCSLIGRMLPHPPTIAATHLHKSNHAPTVFLDNHGPEVDVWAVGMLIIGRSRDLFTLPSDFRVLGEALQSGTLSAIEALERVNILKEYL